jgi:hypothetical protein
VVGTIENKDRKRSAECFQINCCSRGVVPKKLRTDSGAEFKFKGLDDFLKSNNVNDVVLRYNHQQFLEVCPNIYMIAVC